MPAKREIGSWPFLQNLEQFFFRPLRAETLAVMRIATGAMVAYIHAIWMLDLNAFVGPHALIDNETWVALHRSQSPDFKWTYLAATESMLVMRLHFLAAIGVGLAMSVGCLTRLACLAAWGLTLMTVHRFTGLLFGLDQITVMLSMYLCISRCGAAYSVDAWIAQGDVKWGDRPAWRTWATGLSAKTIPRVKECWSNRLATRLMQLHLCIIYVFGGIGKMRGETWWDGSAMWYSVAAYEYQSLDMTWMGRFPWLTSIATHITVFWELWYCALVWPRWSRPWTLGIACVVHGGIAVFLGMVTFGSMMIVANLAFVSPDTVRRFFQTLNRNSHT
jgi:hypothetical protein